MNKLIEAVMGGASPAVVLDEAQIGIEYRDGMTIRTFFDSYGDLRFCTNDDILIDHHSDSRLMQLREISNSAEADSHLLDLFGGFVGKLDDLLTSL